MNSLSFKKPNLVNPEPIEWQLNSVFTNKYGKIWCWLRLSIGGAVFGFIANVYKRIAIQLLSTNHNIRSVIRWAITKVILNYSPLPSLNRSNLVENVIITPSIRHYRHKKDVRMMIVVIQSCSLYFIWIFIKNCKKIWPEEGPWLLKLNIK